jgi:hypothetical protein
MDLIFIGWCRIQGAINRHIFKSVNLNRNPNCLTAAPMLIASRPPDAAFQNPQEQTKKTKALSFLRSLRFLVLKSGHGNSDESRASRHSPRPM